MGRREKGETKVWVYSVFSYTEMTYLARKTIPDKEFFGGYNVLFLN